MSAETLAAAAARPADRDPGAARPVFEGPRVVELLNRTRETLAVVAAPSWPRPGLLAVPAGAGRPGGVVVAELPPVRAQRLGDASFCAVHGTRWPYVAGEMANGIATVELVTAMARAGMLGFFGAAGLRVGAVEREVGRLAAALGERPNWGVNLIHSPGEPRTETAVADLLVARRVPAVSASAFMELTPAVVRVSAHGLTRDAQGRVRRSARIFAKVSRTEVAAAFMAPAPAPLLRALVEQGRLTADEAELAGRVPVAEDVTVEADSGGHTDNRPLVTLVPEMLALAEAAAREHGYDRSIRVGAAGGLGTPAAVAAAFALGAAYVLTGSVNQAALESGLSVDAKRMLAEAGPADVVMAPAADMFELGVRLQVLRRGSMFAFRAERLYQIYAAHAGWTQVAPLVRGKVEREIFRASYDAVWEETRRFWLARDPEQAARGERDPRHQMALVFRWYLGMASRWAIGGAAERRADYQIWCGPAMGAFNRWVAGGFLADPAERSVVQIARNLLEGAAVVTRAQQARCHGVAVPAAGFGYVPRLLGDETETESWAGARG
ncbi:PfaD family polyunsaturated fatty acid/polyketide biosynthesis protein [Actinospica durhamensis]|uniref:PfaD family polyunsaturated fatty acid/polyketide biosynthesis protein n=1 Tax=Actinospica durhamensis TaxID=1508375 RepID=A0A941EX78_9ACTN|nr:PfaD family polyunsaturated fatty acid/polyketide biosynthesis protein [Actinospica durhamensis]MBR7837997.1 PfaD family polyunsaturated fatty acid/polyketide biosynthesis protein [Actinospica durhamensis]